MANLWSTITFETGDLSQFSSTTDNAANTSLTVSGTAAKNGSYGMLVTSNETSDANTNCYGAIGFTAPASSIFRTEFWWRQDYDNNTGYNTTNSKAIFSCASDANGRSNLAFINRANGDLNLYLQNDSFAFVSLASWSPSVDTWYKIRLIFDWSGANLAYKWEYSTDGSNYTTIINSTTTSHRFDNDDVDTAVFGHYHVNQWEKSAFSEWWDDIAGYDDLPSTALEITPNLLTNTSTFHSPTVSSIASQDITANLLTNSNSFYTPEAKNIPTYIGNASTSGSTASTNTEINVPSGTADGDLMIAVVAVELTSASITAPNGWTLLTNTPLSTRTHTQNVYARLAGNEPASYTWTHSSAERMGVIVTYRNAQFPTLYNSQANNSTTASCTAPALTLDRTLSTALWIGSSMYGATWTAPTNYTERFDGRTSTGTSNLSVSIAERRFTSTGSTGAPVGTSSNADYNIGASVAFGPAKAVLPSALTNTSTIHSPTVELGVAPVQPNLLENTSTFHSPTITTGVVAVSPNLLVNTSVFNTPTITTTVTISPDALENTTVFYDSSISGGSVFVTPDLLVNSNTLYSPELNLSVEANLLTNTSVVEEPTVTPGSVTVSPDLLTNTSALYTSTVDTFTNISADTLENTNQFYSPTITTGSVSVTPDVLTNTNTVYSPSINTDAVVISPDLLENTSTVYTHTVSPGQVTITTDLLTNTSTVFTHAISTGAVDVDVNLLENSSIIYSPVVDAGAKTVVVELLVNNNTFYNSEVITGAVDVEVNLLENSNTVYEPTISVGSVTVATNTLENTNTIYTPVVNAGSLNIVPEQLINSNAIYGIIVSAGSVDIIPDLLENTNQVFAPDVVQSVTPVLLENTSQVFSPALTQNISTQILINTNGFYSPEITTGAANIQTDRVESTTQFHSPWVYMGGATTLTTDLLVNTSVFYNPTLVDRYGRINRVSATSRTNELSSTTREYDILVN